MVRGQKTAQDREYGLCPPAGASHGLLGAIPIHQNEETVRKRREGIRPLKEKLDKKLRQYTKQVKGKGGANEKKPDPTQIMSSGTRARQNK